MFICIYEFYSLRKHFLRLLEATLDCGLFAFEGFQEVVNNESIDQNLNDMLVQIR